MKEINTLLEEIIKKKIERERMDLEKGIFPYLPSVYEMNESEKIFFSQLLI